MKAKDSYAGHRWKANKRGIPFLLTFEEWNNWWLSNGIDKNQKQPPMSGATLCMCRFGDVGPYSLTNIYCDTISNNVKHGRKNKTYIGTGAKGRPFMTPDGEFPSFRSACKFYNINKSSLYGRMKRHPTQYYYL
jgi:hypothetical protein